MYHPFYRPRRLRQHERLRQLIQETRLSVHHLILPLFVVEGEKTRSEIPSLPGHYHLSVDCLVEEAGEVRDLEIPAVILFGIPASKDPLGSGAYAKDGIIQRAVRSLKAKVPELLVFTDVCLCEYTSHGHCGVVKGERVDNDPTLELLSRTALSHAEAGADVVAPSDMMDGRVGAIRETLDSHGFSDLPILSYAAKYASAFYGPFREAADSTPQFGDRRSYQMDPANVVEALREVRLDVEEGADMIMVKPALPYLDVIWRVKQEFDLPVAAFNVSGEYVMIKAAGRQGWIDEEKVMLETLTSIKRAGADFILTYFAKEVARKLSTEA